MIGGNAVLPLVGTDWLGARLAGANIRIVDCTTGIRMTNGRRAELTPSRRAFEREHIPGAVYVDMVRELSDPSSHLTLMSLPGDRFAHTLAKLGIGADTHVVAYSSGEPWWATRLWWLFRRHGFMTVSVLDGGLARWKNEGRPLAFGEGTVAPVERLPLSRRAGGAATVSEVRAALVDGSARVVSARLPSHFRGEDGNSYGRPGRIAGSVNVPAASLYRQDGTLLGPTQLGEVFAAAGVGDGEPVIAYCGLGIAASAVVFARHLTGHDNAILYDGSLEEWAAGPGLPMECG